MSRLPLLVGVLLLGCASVTGAESPLPDPVPLAVIGRPLDEVRPVPPARPKPAAQKAARSKHATATDSTKPARPAAAAQTAAAAPKDAPGTQRVAKAAVDDRSAAGTGGMSAVGKGTHYARKPLAPGAYIGEKHRAAARKYFEAHPVAGASGKWTIGEPVPGAAALKAPPEGLLASLPTAPPGHRYIQLGGDVLLIAGSGMVVDGISRGAR